MKTIALLLFCFASASLKAVNPYILYLVNSKPIHHNVPAIQAGPTAHAVYIVPRYQIPRGAVFCRMEDKLTKATGVWIKVGVR